MSRDSRGTPLRTRRLAAGWRALAPARDGELALSTARDYGPDWGRGIPTNTTNANNIINNDTRTTKTERYDDTNV